MNVNVTILGGQPDGVAHVLLEHRSQSVWFAFKDITEALEEFSKVCYVLEQVRAGVPQE